MNDIFFSMLRVIYLIILTSLSLHISAQSNVFKGQILDAVTRIPIAKASVYVDGSTYWTTSDEQGFFVLNYNKMEEVRVNVSCVGFEKKKCLVFSGADIVIELSPLKIEIDGVSVLRNRQYKRRRKEFEAFFSRELVGTGTNAEQTIVLNPEVLIFEDDESKGIIKVHALEPIRLHNKALGYKLTFDLDSFLFNYNTNQTVYMGSLYFEDVKEENHKSVLNARKHAYEWSLLRFFRSTYSGTWREDGYSVYKFRIIPNEEKQSVVDTLRTMGFRGYYLQNFKFPKGIDKAHREYYYRVFAQPDFFQHLGDRLSENDVAYSRDDGAKKILLFKEYIYVKNEKLLDKHPSRDVYEEGRFWSYMQIVNLNIPVMFGTDGVYTPISNVLIHGYMGSVTKLSNLLPIDYLPKD